MTLTNESKYLLDFFLKKKFIKYKRNKNKQRLFFIYL